VLIIFTSLKNLTRKLALKIHVYMPPEFTHFGLYSRYIGPPAAELQQKTISAFFHP